MPRKLDTKAVSVYLSPSEYLALGRMHSHFKKDSLSKTLGHLINAADEAVRTSSDK